jgi:hypothetical protein
MLRAWLALASIKKAIDAAGIENKVGAIFSAPSECTSNTACSLSFGANVYVGPATSFVTRSFGGMPGPTMRVSAGTTLTVSVSNLLLDINNTPLSAVSGINVNHEPNSTNLHTHGIHVSGAGNSDNVFTVIPPGKSLTYSYAIPSNHMGGTFFYHPHKHGAVALQAGGGAIGLLIIKDEPLSLPTAILSMVDVPVVLQYIEPVTMSTLQLKFNDALWKLTGSKNPILLTNGQTSPAFTVQPGKWYRFRFLYMAVNRIMTLTAATVSGTANCELQLIAKDGIYLPVAPRLITTAYFAQGSRADIAIRCTGLGTIKLNSAIKIAQTVAVSTNYLAMSIVVAGTIVNDANLPSFSTVRPCYLVSTLNASPTTTLPVTLGTGLPNTKINNIFFSSASVSLNPLLPFVAGTCGQITITQGAFVHSLHIHVICD